MKITKLFDLDQVWEQKIFFQIEANALQPVFKLSLILKFTTGLTAWDSSYENTSKAIFRILGNN